MKNLLPVKFYFALIFLLLGVLFLTNCNTTKGISTSKDSTKKANLVQPDEDESVTASWSSLFRQIPGIDVRGSNEDLTLRIRGSKSLQGDNSPLFVLDGVPLGHSFSSLASTILPKDVGSIRVLKGGAASIYGARGANGVVVVNAKE